MINWTVFWTCIWTAIKWIVPPLAVYHIAHRIAFGEWDR